MIRQWYGFIVMVAAGGALVVSCVVPVTPPGTPALATESTSGQPATAPPIPDTATSVPATVTPTPVTTTPASGSGRAVNLFEVFPPGPGQDLVFQNCTACHTFVRIVLTQRTVERWAVIKTIHRDRVSGLSDANLNTLFAYLEENFNDTMPEPELPEWVRQLW